MPQNTLIHFSSSGRDVLSAVPSRAEGKSQLMDFVTFLAVAQKLDIDFLPINWQPALSEIGEGGTAGIRQSLISLQMSFAFKVIKTAEWMDAIDESQRPRKTRLSYQALIAEISVLRHPSVCEHPNIISLLGICWDILPSGRVWPVLVFEKTALRDLWNFIKSEVGKTTPFDTRIKLCADVAVAVRDLHQSGKYSLSCFLSLKCADLPRYYSRRYQTAKCSDLQKRLWSVHSQGGRLWILNHFYRQWWHYNAKVKPMGCS